MKLTVPMPSSLQNPVVPVLFSGRSATATMYFQKVFGTHRDTQWCELLSDVIIHYSLKSPLLLPVSTTRLTKLSENNPFLPSHRIIQHKFWDFFPFTLFCLFWSREQIWPVQEHSKTHKEQHSTSRHDSLILLGPSERDMPT